MIPKLKCYYTIQALTFELKSQVTQYRSFISLNHRNICEKQLPWYFTIFPFYQVMHRSCLSVSNKLTPLHSAIFCILRNYFTHWGRVTHICVVKLTIIGSDNGLSPGRRQAIIWTNAGILLFGPLGTNFIEILIGIQTFLLKKIHLKMSSAKWRPFVSASMC